MQKLIRLNDGNSIPQIGLGVWQATNEQVQRAINCAFEAGYRAIDTASIYGNEQGVGHAIKNSGLPRQDIFVTTKLWNNEQQQVREALSRSIDLLQLDYLDCYLIHWPAAANHYYVAAWQELVRAQQEGLIKSIGVSNFMPEHLQQIIAATGVVPVINQIELHPLLPQKALSAYCRELDIHIQAWSPLAQGGDGVFNHNEVINIARRHGKSPAQVVLRWHLQNDILVIPKSVTPWRICENFNIFDFELSPDELSIIDKLNQNKRLGPDPRLFV